jgi:acyl-CoA thioester hydrolase
MELTEKYEFLVRFCEVDSMNVVWHGHYAKYFEDGRESFGRKYGLHYTDFINNRLFVPIVKLEIDYKSSLKYDEKAIIETKYIDCEAAKVYFEYTIYRSSNNEIVATGRSVQVFLNEQRELLLTNPPYFTEWKKKWNIIKDDEKS